MRIEHKAPEIRVHEELRKQRVHVARIAEVLQADVAAGISDRLRSFEPIAEVVVIRIYGASQPTFFEGRPWGTCHPPPYISRRFGRDPQGDPRAETGRHQ